MLAQNIAKAIKNIHAYALRTPTFIDTMGTEFKVADVLSVEKDGNTCVVYLQNEDGSKFRTVISAGEYEKVAEL